MKNYKIKSFWQSETGRWSEKVKGFVERQLTEEVEKELEVYIIGDEDPIIKFIGGPTGHESFYIKELLSAGKLNTQKFYICAGTINSWPSCYVLWSDLEPILRENS